MALQAFIDDSMTADTVLVMAGYIADAGRWSSFSDEWAARLSMRPRMAAFKMADVDINSELQMERVRHFYKVIEDHVQAQIAIAINCAELVSLVDRSDVTPLLRNPYILGHKIIVDLAAQHQRAVGLDEPVDFIFDKRSEEHIVKTAFAHYKNSVPDEYADLIGQTPVFRDDKQFLPLQAADLLAWWVRRWWHMNGGKLGDACVAYPWHAKQIPTIILDVCGSDLREEIESAERKRQEAKIRRLLQRHQEQAVAVKVSFSLDPSLRPEPDAS